jgi:ABC-type multidrug transport system fused ATPase/permease subunit
VAHRLNTLRDCDLLLVLENGALKISTANFREAVTAAGGEQTFATLPSMA